ncbi:rhomboid-related protein 1 isoform X5 [Lutra lutra]|uniref:rhomboid-related protein 1 isoform X5 n=1 Tax=Lutra lutra TaxID=9657 RepID=UPI001FD4DF9B|nr:rhomboid-related protein 1 isoform X5 [Lutra lutra]
MSSPGTEREGGERGGKTRAPVGAVPSRGASASRARACPGRAWRGRRRRRARGGGRLWLRDAAPSGAGGAGGPGRSGVVRRAAPSGRGRRPRPPAPPGSMDRSSLLQLIQEQQLDPEHTGFIGADTFTGLVHSHELPLDPAKLDMLVALAQSNERGQVCYQELVDLISSKRSSSFKRAIANGQRALPRDGLLDEPGLGVYKRFVRYVAYEILPREVDRHWYFYRHRSCPPPVFMASVTLAQIIVFLCYGARLNKWVLQTYHPEYMKSPLVYHPGHRARAWRFLTYMFMHVGLEQLGFNALLQLMIGVPLEMVHGLLRISLLYLAGVLAELGWDEVSLQAAEDGAGLGVHEFRGGPGRVAPLFPTAACLRPPAQLHGTPGRCGGRGQHGSDHPAQL